MNPAIRDLEKRNIPPLPCWHFFRCVSFVFTILLSIILGLYIVVDARAEFDTTNVSYHVYSVPVRNNSDYSSATPDSLLYYGSKLDGSSTYYISSGSSGSFVVFGYLGTDGFEHFLLSNVSSGTVFYIWTYNTSSNSWTSPSRVSAITDYNSSFYYHDFYINPSIVSLDYPLYDTKQDCLDALSYVYENGLPVDPGPPDPGPTPPVGHNATFTLPAGNVAFVDFGSSGQEYNVEMRTTFPFNSDLFSGQFSPVSQKWGWADILPTSSGALSSAGQYVVPWYKTEPYNLLKQSKSAYVTSQTMVANGFWNETTTSRYLVINNPYFNTVSADSSGNPVLNNGNITVSVENAVSVRVLSATDSLTSTGIQADVDPDVYYDGTFTDSGGTVFTNQDGAISSPEYGGNNYVPPAASAESLAEQIKNILNDLVSKITTIFTATHDAILTLVSAAREFFGVFGLLYAWLPAEVYAVLQSGMIVAVTIGIFKVFL